MQLLRTETRSAGARSYAPALVLILACGIAGCDDDDPFDPAEDIIDLELVAEGLTAPVALREAPDASDRLFAADQTGAIRVIEADGSLRSQPFLDLSGKLVALQPNYDERGLLGLAFHPDYEGNGRFFVYYSAPLRPGAPAGFNHTSIVSEFTVSSDPDVADAASERILLAIDQPQGNHNGGTLAFGPDGYLYISLGDGGGRDDEGMGHVSDWYDENAGGNAQNVEANFLGSILRIDVDGAQPYAVPAGNPFVDKDGLDEIWAYGFRNPYRFSFDMGGTGALIAGDAGQDLYEEVSVVEQGGNYGWNVKEGRHCFDTANPEDPPPDCPDTGQFGERLVDPVIEYANAGNGGPGIVVVGGFVYRGNDIPDLDGLYIFGDYSSDAGTPDGVVFVASPGGSSWSFEELRFGPAGARLGHYLLGFGQDASGEIYLLVNDTGAPSGNSGRVYRLAFTSE
jgi:glucose/arabinose dehydrogenase